jgi:hypothetical protein
VITTAGTTCHRMPGLGGALKVTNVFAQTFGK